MKSLLWLLTLFALAVGVALAARYNDAYLLLVVPPYRAEVSLNLAVLLGVAAFVVFYALLRGVTLTLALPQRARDFRERRQREKFADALPDIARLVFEGRYGQALKKAGEAYAAGLSPALAALFAAYAAQCLHEPEKQRIWLERARRGDAKMEAACLMLEAQMHIDAQRYDAAKDALHRLQQLRGRHIAALRLELLAEQGAGNWPAALRLVHLLETRGALPPGQARAIRRLADEHAAAAARGDGVGTLSGG